MTETDASTQQDAAAVFYVGRHLSARENDTVKSNVQAAKELGYDMITAPVTTGQYRATVLKESQSSLSRSSESGTSTVTPPAIKIPPLHKDDVLLRPEADTGRLLVTTAPCINLASADQAVADLSAELLYAEVAYAAFCGATNIIIPGPRFASSSSENNDTIKFAQAIKHALTIGPHFHIHILLQMCPEPQPSSGVAEAHDNIFRVEDGADSSAERVCSALHPFDAWDFWNSVRCLCKYSSRLNVALSLPTVLPSMSLQSRWYSEPIRILWLKDSIFLKNAKGYPVLAKTQQALISRYMRLAPAPWLVLADDDFSDQSVSGNSPSNDPVLQPLTSSPDKPSSKSPTPAEASGMKTANKNTEKEDPVARLSYIRYLQRNQPSKSTIEKFGAGYQDYLQAPLQPLADNLESITYEVFETDPVKYDWYQKAMEYAFRDWAAEGRTVSSGDNSIILAVVGAGRGPLVARCLAAAEITKTAVEIWALEKNPNAAVMLEQRNATEWDRKVNLVKSDMRQWEGPRRKDGTLTSVDILVSELLGSLGDNELSPECLDGVHHLLNKHDGISIPQAYSAHMTPIAAPRLHAEVAGRAKIEEAAFETPYVVMLHSIDYLAISPTTKNTDVQYLWAFEHVKSENTNVCSEVNGLESAIGAFESSSKDDTNNRRNARYTKLHFSCPSRGVCHGLAGYFEAVLYAGPAGTVELSTNPLTMEDKSKDMISWFPMLFPLKNPIHVIDQSTLEVSMWRQTNGRKVWYEWVVEVFISHDGKKMRTACTELHSSEHNGCIL